MKRNNVRHGAMAAAGLLLLCAGFMIAGRADGGHDHMAGMSMEMPDHAATAAIGSSGYSLTDQDGKAVTDKDFRGRYQLIYFGFTSCPDVCPLDLKKMTDALKILGAPSDKIAPVFITIDPERDTPAVLKQYLAHYAPAPTGLTGTKEQVAAVEGGYKVYAEKAASDSISDYTMNHSAYLYLMGPDGAFIDVFDPQDKAADIAARLKKVIR